MCKKILLLAVAVMVLFGTVAAAPAAPVAIGGGNPGAIWTTDGSCGTSQQDVNSFPHGHVVYINGSGFNQDDYNWEIKGQPGGASGDPGTVIASGTRTVGSNGSFCFAAYTVQNDDWGEYSVKFGNKGDNYNVPKEDASANVSVGACTWSQEDGSKTPVSITLTGATMTVSGPGGPYTLTSSGTLNLGPGHYTYTWTAKSGFEGSGSGSFDVGDCTPPDASASASVGACTWSEEKGSITPVTITVNHAVVSGLPGGDITETTVLNLAPGDYTATWIAAEGYKGSGSFSFTVHDCTPPNASASVEVGKCSWNQETGSKSDVTVTLSGATMTITGPGGPYEVDASAVLSLGPGVYSYSWEAIEGFLGSGEGTFEVSDCTPPPAGAVVIDPGVCKFGKGTIFTFTLGEGIDKVVFSGAGDFKLEITESGEVILPVGDYSWEAFLKEGYLPDSPMEGTLQVKECPPLPPPPTCPKCGKPQWESSYGDKGPGLAVVWFSPEVCKICRRTGNVMLDSWVKMFSDVASYSVKYRGQCYPSTTREAFNGSTWYKLLIDLNDQDGAFELYADSACTKRVREVMPVYKWNACSVAPGWYSTTKEGFVVELGQNRSDIVSWMLREPGFFSGVPFRGDTIIKWVDDHLPAGPLVPGTVMPLPSS